MSHEIETMAYAGQTPWHGLGVEVDDDLTPQEMLKKAGLDWKVDKVPLSYDHNGKTVVTDNFALVRDSDGQHLTTISDNWKPVQNHDAFEFFDQYTKSGEMQMHTAGSLKGGKIVWALAKIGESFELFGEDRVDSYLLFSNPHTYGKSIDVRFTPIRVVCNNTLSLSLSGKNDTMVRVSHASEFDAEEVKRVLGIAKEKLGTYKEMAQFLSSKTYTQDQMTEYLISVFGEGKKEDKKFLTKPAQIVESIIDTQPGAKYGEGSWWQLFNGVTYATDHLLGAANDTRLASAWYGTNRNRKIVALNKAVEMAA